MEFLPLPVARYLRMAWPSGIPEFRLVRLSQEGALRTGLDKPTWLPFQATHTVTPFPPAFVWNATVSVAPLVHVRVRDALIVAQGSGAVAHWSALRIGGAGGGIEMNSGSLHRSLAEGVWYPTALLPSDRLAWPGIDDSRASATLTEQGLTVSSSSASIGRVKS